MLKPGVGALGLEEELEAEEDPVVMVIVSPAWGTQGLGAGPLKSGSSSHMKTV